VPTASTADESLVVFETDIPARLDRLPWSRFHWLVVMVLGITWILDGLEVTLVGSLAGALGQDWSLALTATETGLAASLYLSGAIVGALGFGYLSDRIGRRRLFTVTISIYALATLLTGCAWNFWSFAVFRFLTGTGIGGEYAAINSAIQEWIPARHRGWTDLAINGSFWIGAALGAVGALIALDPTLVPQRIGWRLAFAIGGLLGLAVLLLRRNVPESPRWLMTHGQQDEGARILTEIEERISRKQDIALDPIPREARVRLRTARIVALPALVRVLFIHYPRRAFLCIVLMASQAFFYNAIFFTYAMMLTRFYAVPPAAVGRYILAFAAGNFLGPLILGRWFDRIGRRQLIAGTYAMAGVLMTATAILFEVGKLDAVSQTLAWTVIFFFASAAASSAYLTVGESFPLEIRALVIALFYAAGTALGGVAGPALFGALIESGTRRDLMWGYLFAAALMLAAALAEALLGVAAEGQPLESVTRPLTGLD
jgi:MFS family permease